MTRKARVTFTAEQKLEYAKLMVNEGYTNKEVEQVMNKLNHRPRKTLNFKTPHEFFFDGNHQKAA